MWMSEARLQGVGDEERNEPDDRRFGREVFQLLDVGVEGELVALLDVADDLANRRSAGAIEALERGIEFRRDGNLRLDLAPGHHAKRADRVAVGGIGHRERKLALILSQRQGARLAQEARGDTFLEDRKFRVAGDVDQREPELRGERFGDVALGAKPATRAACRVFRRPPLHPQRALDAGGIELSAGYQDFAEAHGLGFGHAFDHVEKCLRIIARREAIRPTFAGRIKALHAFAPANRRRRPTLHTRMSPLPDAFGDAETTARPGARSTDRGEGLARQRECRRDVVRGMRSAHEPASNADGAK
jgi:hypothetical protein